MTTTSRHRLALAGITAALLAIPTAAHAGEPAASSGPWSIDGEVGVFSDYRFRGLSLSGKDPEVTAELSVSHESGFYAKAWGSNVDLGNGADDVEVDLSAGWSKELGGANLDVGAIYYTYPGNGSLSYVELYSSLGFPVGPATITIGAAYAPKQNHIGGSDNTYAYISGELPIKDTPLSLHGTFGYEDGAFATGKRDWAIGASYDLGSGFTAGLDYVDTAHSLSPMGKATVVASLKKSF